MDHFKASALSSRSTIIKSDQNRGVAFTQSHPNMSRSKISTSDHNYYRSNDDSRTNNDCKQKSSMKFLIFFLLFLFALMELVIMVNMTTNPSEEFIYFASLNSICIREDDRLINFLLLILWVNAFVVDKCGNNWIKVHTCLSRISSTTTITIQ